MQKKGVTDLRYSFVLLISLLFFLGGCAVPVEKKRDESLVDLRCVAVVPVTPLLTESLVKEERQAVKKGAVYATEVMKRVLSGKTGVRLLQNDDFLPLDFSAGQGRLDMLGAVGKVSNCQAVLLTSMQQFQQRQGSDMAIESPASAAFAMTLFQVPSGKVLWVGDYKETQQSFLANVLSGKMEQRGFRWVTVEELVRQALEQRLAGCPYLK